MLFLGAGASNAVGIGQLSALTTRVLEKLKDTKYGNTIKEFLSMLNTKNVDCKYYTKDEIDIEIILSILNNSVKPEESLKDLGPYTIFRSCKEEKLITIAEDDLKDMYKIIDKEITNH